MPVPRIAVLGHRILELPALGRARLVASRPGEEQLAAALFEAIQRQRGVVDDQDVVAVEAHEVRGLAKVRVEIVEHERDFVQPRPGLDAATDDDVACQSEEFERALEQPGLGLVVVGEDCKILRIGEPRAERFVGEIPGAGIDPHSAKRIRSGPLGRGAVKNERLRTREPVELLCPRSVPAVAEEVRNGPASSGGVEVAVVDGTFGAASEGLPEHIGAEVTV